MGAVAGVRRTMRELVDGTLRVQIDIDPKDADNFRRLLPHVDMPVALAPLIPGYDMGKGGDGSGFDETEFPAVPPAQIATFHVNEEEAKEVGGSTWAQLGPLCQSAIMLCKDERFQKWVLTQRASVISSNAAHRIGFPLDEESAAHIRERCGVQSRKQLDEKLEASYQFRQMMREFRRWLS